MTDEPPPNDDDDDDDEQPPPQAHDGDPPPPPHDGDPPPPQAHDGDPPPPPAHDGDPPPPRDVPPQELYPPLPNEAIGFEPPLVPHDASLGDAVGAPSPQALRRKAVDERVGHDDDHVPTRGRRTTIIVALAVVGVLSAVALGFLGHANGERYLLTCDASRVTAEQGRSFPPWGSHAMSGPEWKPITLAADTECKPRETESIDELGGWYLDMLIDRASATLTAKNPLEVVTGDKTSPLDVATEQLDQALLLARAPERRDQRKDIERLLGDVDYWRASARLRDVTAGLLDAAKQFETAAGKRPRHVTDAAAWAAYLRHLADELHAGPNGAPAATGSATGPSAPNPPAPVGTALPVEPEPEGSAAAAPDAGVPAGGVLL